MKKIFLLLIAAFTLTGCSIYQIDSKDTTEDYFAPKTNIDQVQYLEKVDKPSQEIGVVTVTTERRQSLKDVLPKLKQEAAIMGGDAITDIQSDATGAWKKIKPQKLLGNAYIRETVSAKVIVFK
ncbi:MAG: membrane lipoprotein lipid attachment site-containing protein [Candidatus Omnitrophica bacterium]|nr:membrane lipoprotein lipid attachment site-containing protein [Candidatus Omnitrophota bacterium]